MHHSTQRIGPVLALLAATAWLSRAGAAAPTSLAHAMPKGAVAYVEVTNLASMIEQIQNSSYYEKALASPQLQEAQKSPQYQKVDAVRKIAEAHLGTDLVTAAKKLLGGQIAVALYAKPHPKTQPDAVAILKTADPSILKQIRERVEPLLVLAADQIATETIDGARVMTLGGKASVAWNNEWIAASSQRELLTKAIGLLLGKEKGALADEPAFQSMTSRMGPKHLARGYVNTEVIKKTNNGRLAPQKMDNALGSLLFAGILEVANKSPYLGVAVDFEQTRIALTLGAAGGVKELDETYKVFFADPAGPGAAPIPRVEGVIGGFAMYRDYAGWYKQREKLHQENILPGFDKFEQGLANLLPGKNFGNDVLPLIGPRLTFVSAKQDYRDLGAEPGIKLPAFAAVIELARPQEGAQVFRLLFQTLTALLNLQAGQQGREPWVMDSENYKGVQVNFGKYLQKPSGERLPIVFNFTPASALVGDRFILSSSVGLCRQLIEVYQKPASSAAEPNRNLNFELYPDALADLAAANRELLESRRVQEGRSAQQAAAEIDIVIEALRHVNLLRLSTIGKENSLELQLEVTGR